MAWLLLPALFAFSVEAALEVFHPLEEDAPEVAAHRHADIVDGPVLHDPSHGDLGDHEHHYCAHSNAVAYVAALGTVFQRVRAYVPVVWNAETVLVRPFFAILERGPPLL